MKLLVGGFACVWMFALALAGAAGQQNDVKHVIIPTPDRARPVQLSALNVERGAEYPSVVELKGNVEIRMPVCVHTEKPGSKRMVLACNGETVLRADEASYHEDTGQVEARGNVTVTPVPYKHQDAGGK